MFITTLNTGFKLFLVDINFYGTFKQGVTTVRFGTELRYGTVRFWQKVRYGITYEIFRKSTVRYGNTVLYFPHRTLSVLQ